jgi:hypothetical protein
MDVWRIDYNMVRLLQVLTGRFDKSNVSELPQMEKAHASQLWGFNSEGDLHTNHTPLASRRQVTRRAIWGVSSNAKPQVTTLRRVLERYSLVAHMVFGPVVTVIVEKRRMRAVY